MKIYYEKYDDTIKYLGDDKVDDWQPSSENITVEVSDDELTLITEFEDGFVTTQKMVVIDSTNGQLVAQNLDEHMGLTVFFQNPQKSNEATLTLINNDYIVGRYLRTVDKS